MCWKAWGITTLNILANIVYNYTTRKCLSDIYIELPQVKYGVLHPPLLMIIHPRMMSDSYILVNLGILFVYLRVFPHK